MVSKSERMATCRGCGEAVLESDLSHINVIFGIRSDSPYCGFDLCEECITELRNRFNITDEELED